MKKRIGLPILESYKRVIETVVSTLTPKTEIEMHASCLMELSISFHFNQSKVTDLLNKQVDDNLIEALKAATHKQLEYIMVGLAG